MQGTTGVTATVSEEAIVRAYVAGILSAEDSTTTVVWAKQAALDVRVRTPEGMDLIMAAYSCRMNQAVVEAVRKGTVPNEVSA